MMFKLAETYMAYKNFPLQATSFLRQAQHQLDTSYVYEHLQHPCRVHGWSVAWKDTQDFMMLKPPGNRISCRGLMVMYVNLIVSELPEAVVCHMIFCQAASGHPSTC